MNVYHRVTNLAKQKKISISSLEKSAELPNGTIYNWKNSKPNIEYVSRVAGVLNTTVDYLVGRTNTPNSDFESSPVDILDDETILAMEYYHVPSWLERYANETFKSLIVVE